MGFGDKTLPPPISYVKQVIWCQPDLYVISKKEEKIDVLRSFEDLKQAFLKKCERLNNIQSNVVNSTFGDN